MLITFPAMHDKYINFLSWLKCKISGKKKLKELKQKWHPDEHWHFYEIDKWISIVERQGFKLVKSRATTMFPPLHLYGLPKFWFSCEFIHKIDSLICRLPLIKKWGQTLMCVFEKYEK